MHQTSGALFPICQIISGTSTWEPLNYWGRERDGPGIEDTKVRRAEPGTGGEDVPNELSVWVC